MENKELMKDINPDQPTRIIKELLSLPDQLKTEESKIQALKFKSVETKRKFDLWEVREMKSIFGKGKEFPNEAIRKTELELRKEKSVEVKALWGDKVKAETEQAELEIEFKYLKRRLNTLHSIALLISGKEEK